jgi:hypothetical protein
VVRFDVPATDAGVMNRGGFEIVDKWSRKEIFLEGAMAERFQDSVHAMFERGAQSNDTDEIDDYLEQYTSIMQQPIALH